jgi:hypothetical protein
MRYAISCTVVFHLSSSCKAADWHFLDCDMIVKCLNSLIILNLFYRVLFCAGSRWSNVDAAAEMTVTVFGDLARMGCTLENF